MDSPYLSDVLAAALSVAIVVGYHAFLRLRVRRDPGYTIQAVLNRGRTAWVERMMVENAGILAVQTLRNSIMGATFFASTAIALIVGTITLSMQSDKVTLAWHSLSPIGTIDTQLWLPKLLVGIDHDVSRIEQPRFRQLRDRAFPVVSSEHRIPE